MIPKPRLNFILFAISITIIAGLVVYGGPDRVVGNILRFDAATIILLLLLTALGLMLRFARFRLLLQRKYKASTKELFPVFVYGISLANVTPGRFGEPLRALLVKKAMGIPTSYVLACIFLERLSDMVAILILASMAFLAVKAEVFVIPFALAAVAIICVIAASQSKGIYFAIAALLNKTILAVSRILFKKRLREIAVRLDSLFKHIYAELHIASMWKTLVVQFIFALSIWGFIYPTLLYISLERLGAPLPFTNAVGIYTLSLIVGLVSFLPGGLGSAEAASTILLTLAGVEYATALAASIITRALSIWDVILAGPICAIFIKEQSAVKTRK